MRLYGVGITKALSLYHLANHLASSQKEASSIISEKVELWKVEKLRSFLEQRFVFGRLLMIPKYSKVWN